MVEVDHDHLSPVLAGQPGRFVLVVDVSRDTASLAGTVRGKPDFASAPFG